MNVWGVVWAGTPSEAREHAVAFWRQVAPRDAPLGELVVLGPQHRDHDHHTLQAVPDLLVDDLADAIAALPEDVQLLGTARPAHERSWVHVRARDGRVYGLSTGCAACRRQDACVAG